MLDRNALRDYCLSLTGAFEDFPFGPEVAVMKVKDKMFALLPIDASPLTISLKADPDEAILQRPQYKAITGGYHLNKRHWNTVLIDGEIGDEQVLELIEDSYLLVRRGLTKKLQAELTAMEKEG
jgi:predicted DNA-binding protein (MmcQ/YjbR family)